MDLKCGYAVSGGVMGGALFGMIVGALVVNASIGYILLLLIAWGLHPAPAGTSPEEKAKRCLI